MDRCAGKRARALWKGGLFREEEVWLVMESPEVGFESEGEMVWGRGGEGRGSMGVSWNCGG